jgi:hypothetical protein
MGQAGAAELRRSAAIRVLVAVLAAAGLTTIAILASWGPLDVHSDVVGYPIFADFNVNNYFTAYYLAVGFFPLAALLLFLGLTRLAPRIGLAAPGPRGSLRPSAPGLEEPSPLAGEPPLAEASETRRRVVCAARIGFVGAVLGLEAGIAVNSIRPGFAAGIAAYALGAVLAALLLGRLKHDWSFETRLAAVNSLGALLPVAGLVAVSMHTQVHIDSNGSVDHYPWFPVWLALPVVAALAPIVAVALRRAGSAARAIGIERRALMLVAAPVALVLLLQSLPGESGLIDMFHGGEQLGGARLVGDGWFPWRDVVLTHGIFQDVIYTWGRSVFGNTHWGHAAGVAMIMKPLYLVSVFFLLVYLVGRNWLFLLFAALLLIGPDVAPEQFRSILWPLILLVLATDLDRPTALKSVGLAFLSVTQAILTPEAAPALAVVAVVLIAYEWYWRKPGASIASAFPRTLWFAGAGIAFASVFAGYLAAHGALDDYVYISINIVHGHALSGGIPPAPNPGSVSQGEFDVLALAPPVALLISFAYAVSRVRLRRGFYSADWVMAAAALFLLIYYPKFLSRMDTGHVYQPFVAGLPLMFFIVYRAVGAIEGAIRNRWPQNFALRVSAHPVSLALVVLVTALSWGTFHDRLGKAPAFYRPGVSAPPQYARVGYTQVFDGAAYRDLKRVIDTYLGPNDRLFDFSNTPELFFYFMNRDPSTRYFQVTLAYPAVFQADLIDRLSKASPKLIVFDNDSKPFIGLSNFDGMPTMVHLYDVSQWILDRYRPLLWTHGFTIYARRDMPPASQAHLHLAAKPVTRGVAFSVQPCTWGSAPNFLSGPGTPPPGTRALGAHAHTAPDQVNVIGWAGDPAAKQPTREVIATVDGKIVGRVEPKLDRPDVVAYGLPKGFERAGFQIQVPVARSGRLRLFAVSRDGELTQIVRQGGHPAKGTIRVGGRNVHLEPNAVYGQINSTTRTQALQIELPPGSHWTDYRWLELDAGESGFRDGTFTVYDRQARPSTGREITFQTLDRSPRSYVVPVGSCAQWHAYRGNRLYLNHDTPQDISAVRLIR